jgi:hypothetical protein
MSEETQELPDVEEMSLAELRAELERTKALLAEASKKAKKVPAPAVVRTPEEQAEHDAKVAAVTAKINELEAQLKAAKTELKELVPRTLSNSARGPVGVGAYIKSLLIGSPTITNEEILKLVAEEFPNNFTNVNCINWYRNAIKKWPDGKRPSKAKEAPALKEQSFGTTTGEDYMVGDDDDDESMKAAFAEEQE